MNPRDVLLLASGVVIGALGYHVLKEDKAINVTPDDKEYIDIDKAFKEVRETEGSVLSRKMKRAEQFTKKATNMASSKEAKNVVDSAKGLLDSLTYFADTYEEYFGNDSAKRSSMHRREQNEGRRKPVYGPTDQTPGPRGPQGPGPRNPKQG